MRAWPSETCLSHRTNPEKHWRLEGRSGHHWFASGHCSGVSQGSLEELFTKLIRILGCFTYSRTVCESSSGSAHLSLRYLHFTLLLRSIILLKISRVNPTGVFNENSVSVLSWLFLWFLYIWYRLFPIHFEKRKGRMNMFFPFGLTGQHRTSLQAGVQVYSSRSPFTAVCQLCHTSSSMGTFM